MKRVGILSGGGDCPGINAVLRAAGKTLFGAQYDVVGFEDGFLGVLQGRYRKLDGRDLSGILTQGGTILGTSNRDNPFQWVPIETPEDKPVDNSDVVVSLCRELRLEGIIVIGGDGTLSIARKLHEEKGVPCIGIPKTIDNDVNSTDFTFGFHTAVQTATEAIDRLHSTAMSHHRVMVIEVMGRYVGWLALYAGVAGGADVILLPEIPYKLDTVFSKLKDRSTHGKRFSIVVVAEGACTADGEKLVQGHTKGSTDPVRLGGVGEYIASKIEEHTGLEARTTVLGHLQRGGGPTATDRVLATEFGSLGAKLTLQGNWGRMAALQSGRFMDVSLADATKELKRVPTHHSLIDSARGVGTSFGEV